MKLKVVFIVRSTFDSVRGGDSSQVIGISRELSKLNVKVDVKKATDAVDYKQYHLMHLFNLTRPADHLTHIANSGLPYLLSTNYLDYTQFDTLGRQAPSKYIFRFLGKYRTEYLKTCYRILNRQEKLVSRSYLKGHEKALLEVLRGARLILPNSMLEYKRLKADFGVENEFRIIPNGVNPRIFRFSPEFKRKEDQVLCVGQIYGLKNQHKLIEATRKTGTRLVIIGSPPPNHHAYFSYCKKIAHRNVEFHDFIPQEKLVKYYAESKVHAMPSWFETTGLSSLEAGAMGCNLIVGAGGDTLDYFKNYATFCDAQDQPSLEKALIAELGRKTSFDFREQILSKYTWDLAASETHSAYMKVLENER